MRLGLSPIIDRLGKRFAAALIAAAIVVGGVSFTLGQSINSSSDVKIIAQKLEDGRIEFGLEQDGERILPRARFFPAEARVGRWLKSSAISVDVAAVDPITSATGDRNAETANLWVYLWDYQRYDGSPDIEASVVMPADVDAFDLEVHVAVGRHSGMFCNSSAIFDGVVNQLGCSGTDAGHSHTQVTSVTASVDVGWNLSSVHYLCTKQDESNQEESTWACWLRD